ncbi:MAG: disulfide bond formation protein B [Dongiaceae bacterium]
MASITAHVPVDRRIPLLVAVASLAGLAVAFASQYWGGLQPCILCIYQRYPYGITATLGVIGILAAARPAVLRAILLLAALAFAVDAGIAAFHVGVEQGWWQGTAECGSTLDLTLSPEELKSQLMNQPLVRCDEVAWSLFGISMAGYNFLYALALTAVALWFALRRRRVEAA